STGILNIYLTGDFTMTGGASEITDGAGVSQTASAIAKAVGSSIVLDVLGDVGMRAGTAHAASGGNTADSSVMLDARSGFAPLIGGNFALMGGTAIAQPTAGRSAQAVAQGLLLADGDLRLGVGGNLDLIAGNAVADTTLGGTTAQASADAVLSATGRKFIDAGRDFFVLGGNAAAIGSSTLATAIAGTDAGNVPAGVTLDIRTGRNMLLDAGTKNGAGAAADAALLASGEVRLAVNGPLGLQIDGASGSGLFQQVGTMLTRIDGRAYPITVLGNIALLLDGGTTADAYILSGAPPRNLDSLLAAFLKAIDISRSGRIEGAAEDVNLRDRSKIASARMCR
ncbi:MAG: hypothetical protein KIT18_16340, partial [Burkholderiales bacterium]|nr:hypothetical protein [Burkholderiales bacterium]